MPKNRMLRTARISVPLLLSAALAACGGGGGGDGGSSGGGGGGGRGNQRRRWRRGQHAVTRCQRAFFPCVCWRSDAGLTDGTRYLVRIRSSRVRRRHPAGSDAPRLGQRGRAG